MAHSPVALRLKGIYIIYSYRAVEGERAAHTSSPHFLGGLLGSTPRASAPPVRPISSETCFHGAVFHKGAHFLETPGEYYPSKCSPSEYSPMFPSSLFGDPWEVLPRRVLPWRVQFLEDPWGVLHQSRKARRRHQLEPSRSRTASSQTCHVTRPREQSCRDKQSSLSVPSLTS